MSCIDACQDRFAEILQLAGIVLVSWAGRLRSFTLLTCAHFIFILPGSLKAKQFLITNEAFLKVFSKIGGTGKLHKRSYVSYITAHGSFLFTLLKRALEQ